jgi:hypothetical protein
VRDPVGGNLDKLATAEPGQRAITVGVEAPAVLGVTVLGTARRSNQENASARLEHADHFEPGHPEVFDVFERLPGYHQVDRTGTHRQAIRRIEHDIHTRPGLQIDPAVLPAIMLEKRAIGAIHVVGADVHDREPMLRIQIPRNEVLHMFVRANVHSGTPACVT